MSEQAAAAPEATPQFPSTTCPHCEASVPDGVYCGACGAHLHVEEGGRRRMFAFAAAPGEHLFRLSLISTLLPHLPHRHSHKFRDALVVGSLAVGGMLVLGWDLMAVAVALLLLPCLYLLYLYEVEVFEHEPVLAICATVGVGGALGALFQWWLGNTLGQATVESAATIFWVGAGVTLIAQLLMVAGPLVLLSRSHFNEVLDGVAFGIGAALGFTAIHTLWELWPLLTAEGGPQLQPTTAAELLLTVGLFAAIVNAAASGTIVGLYWTVFHSGHVRRHGHIRLDIGLIVLVLIIQGALGGLLVTVGTALGRLLLSAAASMVALLVLRVVIHFGLLDEVTDEAHSEPLACPECHAVYPRMLFCPHCGVARSAAPKRRPLEASS